MKEKHTGQWRKRTGAPPGWERKAHRVMGVCGPRPHLRHECSHQRKYDCPAAIQQCSTTGRKPLGSAPGLVDSLPRTAGWSVKFWWIGCNLLAPCRCAITINFPGYLYCNSLLARLPPREKKLQNGNFSRLSGKPFKIKYLPFMLATTLLRREQPKKGRGDR
jgi:hypothetical protein